MTAMAIIDAAIAYASYGWRVFPVVGKRPACRHGFHEAVANEHEVRNLFGRHIDATGVGVACGASGLLVVDLDGEDGRLTWTRLAARQGDTVPTRIAVTGGGGWHLVFHGKGRSSAGKLGPGIDTRGQGGYVLAPPSLHPSGTRYRWRDPEIPIASAPSWLLRLLEPSPVTPAVGHRRDLPDGAAATAYGEAALEGLADDMLRAVEGTRNDTLVRVAHRAGRLAAGGELAENVAHDVLVEAALETGLGTMEAARTFRSGFQAGLRVPSVRAGR